MTTLIPPPLPPRVATTEDNAPRNFHMRTVQVMATLLTLLVTAWICTLGAIPAIIGLMAAKHVLVAILVMGLGVDAPRSDR